MNRIYQVEGQVLIGFSEDQLHDPGMARGFAKMIENAAGRAENWKQPPVVGDPVSDHNVDELPCGTVVFDRFHAEVWQKHWFTELWHHTRGGPQNTDPEVPDAVREGTILWLPHAEV